MVVSNIFYFHPYLGKWSNLTNIFQMGWNHQPVKCLELFRSTCSKVVASNEPKVWPTIPAQRGCHCLSVGTSLGHALKLHVVVGLPSLKRSQRVYTWNENPLEMQIPIGNHHFWGLYMLVSGRVCVFIDCHFLGCWPKLATFQVL